MMRRCSLSQFVVLTLIAWSVLQSMPSGVSGDLLLFYDFDTATDEDIVVDASGTGNDADVIGAEYTGPGGGRSGGASDRAMDFLTHQDAAYIDIPSVADGAFDSIVDNDAATVSLWLFGSDEQPVDGTIFWFAGNDQRQMLAHVPWSDTIIYFDMAGCDSCLFTGEPDESKYKGEWNHYAFVKDGPQAAIYQNGELLIETGNRDALDNISTARFGTFASDSYPYSGLMDDVGVWDEPLTEDQIRDIMQNGIGTGTRLEAGDANMDLEFNFDDILLVLSTNKFETGAAATWGEGDWDGAPGGSPGNPPLGDGRFDFNDILAALSNGLFEAGPYAAAAIGQTQTVPEPSTWGLAALGLLTFLAYAHRRRSL